MSNGGNARGHARRSATTRNPAVNTRSSHPWSAHHPDQMEKAGTTLKTGD